MTMAVTGWMKFSVWALMFFFLYLGFYTTFNCTSCDYLYKRPHEKHKIKIKPQTQKFPFNQLEKKDETKLINLTNFAFIHSNEILCANSEVFLLILVPSGPKNKLQRDSIRRTWGYKHRDIKLLFMLGMSEDKEIEAAIEEESATYQDVVQGNFIDDYKNMSYKSVMSFKYVTYHCPQAAYVLKIDDDSFVNMPMLLNFLKHDLSPYGAEDLFLCNDMTGSPALRDPNSKWYVSKEEFAEEYYPSYCSGWYAILSPDVCFKLYKESQKLPYLFIDDAFVYGIAAAKANLTHVDFSYYTLAYRGMNLLFNGTFDNIPIMFGSPNLSPEIIEKTYQYFRSKPVPKSIHKQLG